MSEEIKEIDFMNFCWYVWEEGLYDSKKNTTNKSRFEASTSSLDQYSVNISVKVWSAPFFVFFIFAGK